MQQKRREKCCSTGEQIPFVPSDSRDGTAVFSNTTRKTKNLEVPFVLGTPNILTEFLITALMPVVWALL